MRWYKLMLWKAYFDEGYGFTSYIKYLIAVIGGVNSIITSDLTVIIIAGLAYGVACVFLGRFIFRSKMKDAMLEVQNNVNPFQKEVRQSLGITPKSI